MMTAATPHPLRLGGRLLVCDGAMGTMLHAAGNSLDQSLPALSLSAPDLVKAVHGSYVSAGVDILQTNTFGASRLRLGEYGMADQVEEINRAAVLLARASTHSDRPILVAGSVSPAVSVQQRRRTSRSARLGALQEQIAVLVDAGVDVVLLETFGYLHELIEAVQVATAEARVPVIAQATFGADTRTLSGHTPREVVLALSQTPIAALGTNCTLGPKGLLTVLREMRGHTDLPLTAQPNAGLPRRIGPARFEYDIDSEYIVRYIRQLAAAGASVVGGCCGTTPTQIAAVVEMVHERQEHLARSQAVQEPPADSSPAPSMFQGPGTILAVEVAPELGIELAESAATLAGAGVHLVSVASVRSTGPQVSPVSLALHLQPRTGLPTMASVTTWDRTIMTLQADLLGAHALGLRRVVCETGSPPLVGDYPHVDGIWDVDSIGLIELLRKLNEGTDLHGLSLPAPTEFEIGARINPGSRDLERAVRDARDKIRAGVDFLITRPLYDVADLERLLEAIGDELVPVLAAVRPLRSFDEAEYLVNEVPDTRIPAHVLEALEKAGSAGDEAGLAMAADLVERLIPLVRGVVIAPAGRVVVTVRRLVGDGTSFGEAAVGSH